MSDADSEASSPGSSLPEHGSRSRDVRLDAMGEFRRSHRCGEVTPALIESEVVLTGWVHKRRDHGGVIFVDLRDRYGIVQVVFKPEVAEQAHERGGELRTEYVILVRGVVERRSDETINPDMPTGQVEVTSTSFASSTPPRLRPSRSKRIRMSTRACGYSTACTISGGRRFSTVCRFDTRCTRQCERA